MQTLSRKDKKTKQVKQEEDNAVKVKKRAQKDAKRITAELIAKAKKDSENAQQLAKQVYNIAVSQFPMLTNSSVQALKLQAQQKQEAAKLIEPEDVPEEREISKKRNRKGSTSNNKKAEQESQPEVITNQNNHLRVDWLTDYLA